MPITLTAAEFEVAWELLGLGDLPLIFRVRIERPGLTDDERTAAVRSGLDVLRRRGHAGRGGIGGELADQLMLLANPGWVVDARLHLDRPVWAYGAAGQGDGAALATLDGGLVTIAGSSRYALPRDIAALAGEPPPGPGRSINVPAATLVAAGQLSGGDSQRLGDELIDRGVPIGDARMLAKLNGEMFGSGQFGVEVVDHEGALRRAARVVGFCDSPQGRWAQLRTNGDQPWITFTPATPARLAAMIGDLLAECGVRSG